MTKHNPQVISLPVTFKAEKDHVVAVFVISKTTLGLRFTSPEMIAQFMVELMEKAAKVWPDNGLVKEYLSDE